jgi:hypothetical protein
MERSIDELLSGEPAEAPVAEAQETVNEQAAEPEAQADDRPRDEHGRFLPKEASGVEEQQAQPVAEAAPPAAQSGLPPAEYAALKDERRKRQELEQQVAALNARFEATQRQPVQQEPEVEFWDNPKGAIASEVQRAVQQVFQAQQQQQTMERINASETAAKGKYADYDDAFRAFQQAASANPSLIQQMTAAGDPADFAYRTGKRSIDLEKLGGLDELIASERAKWEQEARAAMPVPHSLPSTTATDGSVGGRAGPAWGGPPTIDDILR